MAGSLETRSDKEIDRMNALFDQSRKEIKDDGEDVPGGPIPIPQHKLGHKNYRHRPYEVQNKLKGK